jgi:hypothetical protein
MATQALKMMIERYEEAQRAPSLARSCQHCRWVNVRLALNGALGLGCLHPRALYGQAGRNKDCCSYEREPGSDDELQ